MNLLSRLGFSTARTPDALEYARGELAKLVEISNQSTELTRHIEALNLRKINTLGSRFDTNDINLDYDNYLNEFHKQQHEKAKEMLSKMPRVTSAQAREQELRNKKPEQGEASQGDEAVLGVRKRKRTPSR